MKIVLQLILFTILCFGCTNDSVKIEKQKEKTKLPTTYDFKKNGVTSVNFYKERLLLDMHSALEREAKFAQYINLSKNSLKRRFFNSKSPFTYNHKYVMLFNDSKVLNQETEVNINSVVASSKKNIPIQQDVRNRFLNMFKEIVAINKFKLKPASEGKAGYLFYGKDYDKRLVNVNGIEVVQDMTKSLMGAMQLDRIINHFLSSELLNVDNTKNVASRNYTKMEHNWDSAFALTGLPVDSELNYIDGSSSEKAKYGRFWSEYIFRVDKTPAGKNIKKEIYNAFILGRKAITEKRYDERDKQAAIIKKLLTKVCAIRAAYYLNQGVLYLKDTESDRKGDATHNISEGIGFAYSLRFTPDRLILDEQINAIKLNGGIWQKDIVAKLKKLINAIVSEYNIVISDL